jgi:hypothetical protein
VLLNHRGLLTFAYVNGTTSLPLALLDIVAALCPRLQTLRYYDDQVSEPMANGVVTGPFRRYAQKTAGKLARWEQLMEGDDRGLAGA